HFGSPEGVSVNGSRPLDVPSNRSDPRSTVESVVTGRFNERAESLMGETSGCAFVTFVMFVTFVTGACAAALTAATHRTARHPERVSISFGRSYELSGPSTQLVRHGAA